MAIEINPKSTSKLPTLINILFYFSLVLVLTSVSVFFILDYYQNQTSQTLKELEIILNEGKTSQEVVLEKEILGYQKKINNFSFLIDSHKDINNFFPILEKNTHPKVEFTQFSLNPEDFQITLSGETESFQTLDQQILIFKQEKLIKDFSLSELFINKDGGVRFGFIFFLNPQIFK